MQVKRKTKNKIKFLPGDKYDVDKMETRYIKFFVKIRYCVKLH